MTPYGKTPLRGTFDGTNAPTVTCTLKGAATPAAWDIKAVEVEFEDAGDEQIQTDGVGTVDGFIDLNPHDAVTLKVIMKAGTKALAQAAAKGPKKFTEVVLSNFIAAAFAHLNGTYAYTKGGKFKITGDEETDAEWTIPLRKFYKPDGTAVDTNVSTGILKPIT